MKKINRKLYIFARRVKPMTSGNKTIAGTILFVAGVLYLFGTDIGTHFSNTNLFNSSVIVLGLLVIVSAFFIQMAYKSVIFTILLVVTGITAVVYILFPVNSNTYLAFAYTGYIFAGLAAIASYKFEKSPLSYISILLGILIIITFALWAAKVDLSSGIQMPPSAIDDLIMPWLIGFGAHIIQDSDKKLAT